VAWAVGEVGLTAYDVYDTARILKRSGREHSNEGFTRWRDCARFNLTFSYDFAERLTHVREGSGSLRLLKQYTYAAANGVGEYDRGKKHPRKPVPTCAALRWGPSP